MAIKRVTKPLISYLDTAGLIYRYYILDVDQYQRHPYDTKFRSVLKGPVIVYCMTPDRNADRTDPEKVKGFVSTIDVQPLSNTSIGRSVSRLLKDKARIAEVFSPGDDESMPRAKFPERYNTISFDGGEEATIALCNALTSYGYSPIDIIDLVNHYTKIDKYVSDKPTIAKLAYQIAANEYQDNEEERLQT